MLNSNAMIAILINQVTAVMLENATSLLNPVNVMILISANIASSKVLAQRWLCKTHFMGMVGGNLSIWPILTTGDQSWFTTDQYTSKNYPMGIFF